jgi:FixJ family two-component response regulator
MGRCPPLADACSPAPASRLNAGNRPWRGGGFGAVPWKNFVPGKALISIVDDDASLREALKGLLQACGFAAEAFPSAEAFLTSARLRETRCLIADVQMPRVTGFQLQAALSELGLKIPVIFITAYPNDRIHARAAQLGGLCLSKPFNDEDLLDRIRSALDRQA